MQQKNDKIKETDNQALLEIKKQAEEYLCGWQRARADYENLKKESEKEKGEWFKFANLNLISELLVVYSHLNQAFAHLDFLNQEKADEEYKNKVNAWVKGLEQIKKQFQDLLNFQGVEEIEPKIGDEFNPEIYEAVLDTVGNAAEGSQAEETTNKVVKVISHGYKIHGKVIMPARVVVK